MIDPPTPPADGEGKGGGALRISAKVLDRILDRVPVLASQLRQLRGARAARKKPGELVHGVDDVPPPVEIVFLLWPDVGNGRITTSNCRDSLIA